MEEKINNQKIFSYLPSLLINLILENPLKDKDIFFNIQKKSNYSNSSSKYNKNATPVNSIFINPNVFPIETILPSSLIMNVKLKGFYKLMSTLIIKDPKNQKEKLISEYMSIITPRILLKISGIIAENGGEIVKYNDFELTAIWINSDVNNIKFNKFNAKLGLISAIEIMKKVDKSEISRGVKLEISIGMAMGDISCVFFGGERKRSEFVILGKVMERALLCLKKCLPHEIILSKELNDIFKKGSEITTMQIDENYNYFSLLEINEEKLRDFSTFKGLKLNNNIVYMNKIVYENLSNKVHILSSILPQGLIKYLDIGIEGNLQEINMVTVVTILLNLDFEINEDFTEIQNIIFDIQKATYLTFGTLLHISKISEGLLIRCVWGLDPGSFIDDTARAISSSSLIGNLTKCYKIKVGIGIATGSCFSGLISLQGNKKFFAMLGKKVNLSRQLANEAYRNIETDKKLKYLIYCDKSTVKKSQKWYRHIFVSQFRIHVSKKNDNFYESKDDFFYGQKKNKLNKDFYDIENENIRNLSDEEINTQKYSKFKNIKKSNFKRNSSLIPDKIEENIDNKSGDEEKDKAKKINIENEYNLINEIFTPVEEEEYFVPNYYDPFPLIRTHLNNAYNPKNKLYYNNLLQMSNSENIYESKKIRAHSISQTPIKKVQSQTKMMIKLQKSQTIFGNSRKIKRFLKIVNSVCLHCTRQFFLIKGPLGVGKTLFIRKCLNNFIGLSDYLSKIYFQGEQYLFCNIMNPFTSTLPFNTVNFILRDIFLNIKRIDKIKNLFKLSKELKLDDEDLKNISFILSIGKKDINLSEEFQNFQPINIVNDNLKIMKDKQKERFFHSNSLKTTKIISYVQMFEGPFNIKNSYKLNIFFFEMIKIYKSFLNSKKELFYNSLKSEKNKKIIKNIPLIFIIDDLHISNKYSVEFIQYLYNNKDNDLNPFIIILIEQTPFSDNFHPITHGIFETFLISLSENLIKPDENKIACFNIEPLIEKHDLEKLIIYYYKESVLNNYKTNLESVDDKILEFLLMKSFHGIPLLVLSLFESLIKSEKFIQTLSGEFIITSELIDDNIICDWSDILLPYIYEKISSMTINSLLSFKELLLLKYASIIGTVFDIKTLDKMNPLKNIIKIKDLEKILIKFNNEYIIETFTEEAENQKNKIQNLICQITFPLMREVLHQKFPMEKRANLHMKTAKILSTSKKNVYFSIEDELKILKRHLLYSEMNIINEIESKEIRTVQDILQNKKVLNYNNLKLYLVKEICSKYYNNYIGNVMEGNLEIFLANKWLKVSYAIDKRAIIFISSKNPKKESNGYLKIIPINNIYKNKILQSNSSKNKNNNLLSIYVSKRTEPMKQNNKEIILFSSEQREEICKLDITINFLRVKVNYDKYVYNYGFSRFPLYKTKWYLQKSLMYYAHLEQNGISIPNNININSMNSLITSKKTNYSYPESFNIKIFNKSKLLKKSFTFIIQSTLSIFLGIVQEKLTLKSHFKDIKEENSRMSFAKNFNYIYIFSIPYHLQRALIKYIKKTKTELEQINLLIFKQNKDSLRDSLITLSHYSSIKIDSSFNKGQNSNLDNLLKLRYNKNKKREKIKKTNFKSLNSKCKNSSKISNEKSVNYDKNTNIIIEFNNSKKNDEIKDNKSKEKINIKFGINEKSKTNIQNDNTNKKYLFSLFKMKNDNDIFVKAEKINQNAEDDSYISDIDSELEENINNGNKSFDSTKNLNSDEDKETNFISNKNDNEYKNDKKYNILKKLNLKNCNNYNHNSLTYRETNKINIFNHRKSDEDLNNFIINTSREMRKLPGDFVPKIGKNDKISHHVELIPSIEINTKIHLNTLDNSFNKSFNEEFNKSFNELKPASLLDNPKYVYLEDNYNNVKVHKSNLLTRDKNK